MKINANINIQSRNWNNVKSHIDRKFEDKRLSERNWDSNLGIDWNLSPLNKSTDGKIIRTNNLNHPYKFCFNKRKSAHIDKMKHDMIIRHVMPFVKAHNASKSVKNNPSRAIKNPLSLYNKNSERTTVDGLAGLNYSHLQTNYDNIKLIQHYYGHGYKHARLRYTKAISYALAKYERSFNARHNFVKKFHWSTNVDETTGKTKPSDRPDALHGHSEIVGFSYTKYDQNGNPILKSYKTRDKNGNVHHHRAGKPSFDVPRALCHEYELKYSRKNANIALSKFHRQEERQIVKTAQTVLTKRFSKVPEFHHMTYTPTKSEQTGLSHDQIKKIFNYRAKMRKTVAERNRNTARRLLREQRKLAYIKAHRKRNRQRAKRTEIAKNKALDDYRSATAKVQPLKSKIADLSKTADNYQSKASNYKSTADFQSSRASSASSVADKAVNNVAKMLSAYSPLSNTNNYQSVAANGAIISGKRFTANDLLTIGINKRSGFASTATATASTATNQTASLISEIVPLNHNGQPFNRSQYVSVATHGDNVSFNGQPSHHYSPVELINHKLKDKKHDFNKWSTFARDRHDTVLRFFHDEYNKLIKYLDKHFDKLNKQKLHQYIKSQATFNNYVQSATVSYSASTASSASSASSVNVYKLQGSALMSYVNTLTLAQYNNYRLTRASLSNAASESASGYQK